MSDSPLFGLLLLLSFVLAVFSMVMLNPQNTHPQHVICYSGAQLIYEGNSTVSGVASDTFGDGLSFVDAKTLKLVHVTGECVVSALPSKVQP